MKTNELSTYNRHIAINVDPQIDFCPGGALAVNEGDQVIEPLNRINEQVWRNGGMVVITGDQHPAITPHFADYGGIWPTHCIAGTKGAQFHPDLTIRPGYAFIDKGTGELDGYSGFDGATRDGLTLKDIIKPTNDNDRTIVVLGGLATEYCVRATALDTMEYAKKLCQVGRCTIDVCVASDAIRAVNLQPDDGAKAIKEMQDAGIRMLTTDELLREGMLS